MPILVFDPSWILRPASGAFDGPVWGDGSVRRGQDARMARGGFSVVQVELRAATIHLTACLSGPLPGPIQTSPAAEACGFLGYLRHVGMPPYLYHTDCQWVVDSWLGGPLCCTAAAHIHADLWIKIWWCIDDLRGPKLCRLSRLRRTPPGPMYWRAESWPLTRLPTILPMNRPKRLLFGTPRLRRLRPDVLGLGSPAPWLRSTWRGFMCMLPNSAMTRLPGPRG